MPSISLVLGLGLLAGLSGFTQWNSRRLEAAHPASGEFLALPGGKIHLTRREPEGTSRGTIVLLHGASGNQSDLMIPLGARLTAKGFAVIAVDRPGHGWSDRFGAREMASPAAQAKIIRAALEKAGVQKAIMLGHSWSGALAANFALDHADFTQGLVLVSPVTHPWPGGVSWYYTPTATPFLGPVFAHTIAMPAGLVLMGKSLKNVFGPQEVPDTYVEQTGLQLVLRPQQFRANAQDVADLFDFVTQQSKRMGDIKIPTGIISGDKDNIVYTHIHTMRSAREIPGASLKILPGIGHSPHWMRPDDIVTVVDEVATRAEHNDAGNKAVQAHSPSGNPLVSGSR